MAITGTASVTGAKVLQRRLQAIRQLPRTIARDPRVAETIIDRTKDRFRRKRGPDNRPWRKLNRNFGIPRSNPSYRDILVETGRLRDSIGLTGRFGLATGLGFRIGITEEDQKAKAALHQNGGISPLTGGEVPARPFLGISPQDVTIIERLLKRIAKEQISVT